MKPLIWKYECQVYWVMCDSSKPRSKQKDPFCSFLSSNLECFQNTELLVSPFLGFYSGAFPDQSVPGEQILPSKASLHGEKNLSSGFGKSLHSPIPWESQREDHPCFTDETPTEAQELHVELLWCGWSPAELGFTSAPQYPPPLAQHVVCLQMVLLAMLDLPLVSMWPWAKFSFFLWFSSEVDWNGDDNSNSLTG